MVIMTNSKYHLLAILATICLVATTGMVTQFARATDDSIDRALKNGEKVSFDNNKDGTTSWSTKHGDIVNTDKHGNEINLASASKADSASAARSENNVKCFAFCLGISNANSGSAANSDSRTNSPGNTATSMPVSPTVTTQAQVPKGSGVSSGLNGPLEQLYRGEITSPAPSSVSVNPNEITPLNTNPISANAAAVSTKSVGTECIDNTGSTNDNGYAKGYVDGNRDSVGLNGHGFDDSLHGKHTDAFKTGYHDGYQAGFDDGIAGKNKNPC
jgi:hypothetical protein